MKIHKNGQEIERKLKIGHLPTKPRPRTRKPGLGPSSNPLAKGDHGRCHLGLPDPLLTHLPSVHHELMIYYSRRAV